MATDLGFVEFICEQLREVPGVSHRKLFGEYAIYLGQKVVALVCDDQLFLKPTAAGLALLEAPVEAPPYPGAKPYFVIDEFVDDSEFLATLFRATEGEVPEPKPKKPKAPKSKQPKTKQPR
jgi:TfoX/Sxy family transcriptional regulator of competence genes